jgi:hypothetical protein
MNRVDNREDETAGEKANVREPRLLFWLKDAAVADMPSSRELYWGGCKISSGVDGAFAFVGAEFGVDTV